uniref:Uncharacterized protein n=1 Tax=Tanacetum cinerariifolium TaxID=118510 RepID=A0A699H0N3_TANCI|nr:hypothetical protein [Tanacetum cinerariifolium]
MWERVERLMRGTMKNKVDMETRYNNEFDQFVAKPGEALKLVNASRAKKLENSHDPLTLVEHTGSSSRNPSPYYVTHPSSVVDYVEDYQEDTFQNNSEDPLTSTMMLLSRAITQRYSNPTNNHLRTFSNTRNQAIVQADRVNIQSKNSSNDGRNTRRSYVQEEIIEGNNVRNDAENTKRTLRATSSGFVANVHCYNAVRKKLRNYVQIARIQLANIDYDAWPSHDSAFLSETAPSAVPTSLLFRKAPVDKVPVRRVRHQDLCAAYATNNRIASNRETGANDPSKSIPSVEFVRTP